MREPVTSMRSTLAASSCAIVTELKPAAETGAASNAKRTALLTNEFCMLFPLEALIHGCRCYSGGFSGADATAVLYPNPVQIRQIDFDCDKQGDFRCQRFNCANLLSIGKKLTALARLC